MVKDAEQIINYVKCRQTLKSRATSDEDLVLMLLKYFVHNRGKLRMPEDFCADIQFTNGEKKYVRLGEILQKMRTIYNNPDTNEVFMPKVVKALQSLDENWMLSDQEYDEKLFLLACKAQIQMDGNLASVRRKKLLIVYKTGKREIYDLSKELSQLRKEYKAYGKTHLSEDAEKELFKLDQNWEKFSLDAPKTPEINIEFPNNIERICKRVSESTNVMSISSQMPISKNQLKLRFTSDIQSVTYYGSTPYALESVINCEEDTSSDVSSCGCGQ